MVEAFVKIVVLHTDRATGAIYLAPWLADTIVATILVAMFIELIATVVTGRR